MAKNGGKGCLKGCLISLGTVFIIFVFLLLWPDFTIRILSRLLVWIVLSTFIAIVTIIAITIRDRVRQKYTRDYFLIQQSNISDSCPKDLGTIIETYTSEKDTSKSRRLLHICENGFMRQSITSDGAIRESKIVMFDDLEGIVFEETNNKVSGVSTYISCNYSFINKSGSILISGKDTYRRKNIEGAEYDNYFGYAFHALLQQWNVFAAKRYKKELDDYGYMTFISGKDVIRLGKQYIELYKDQRNKFFSESRDYLTITKRVQLPTSEHSIDNGTLSITYKELKKKNTMVINVNSMYNKDLFLLFFAIYSLDRKQDTDMLIDSSDNIIN